MTRAATGSSPPPPCSVLRPPNLRLQPRSPQPLPHPFVQPAHCSARISNTTSKNGILDIAPNPLFPRCSLGQQIHDTPVTQAPGAGQGRSPSTETTAGVRGPGNRVEPPRSHLRRPRPGPGPSRALLSQAAAVAPDQPQGAAFPQRWWPPLSKRTPKWVTWHREGELPGTGGRRHPRRGEAATGKKFLHMQEPCRLNTRDVWPSRAPGAGRRLWGTASALKPSGRKSITRNYDPSAF